MPMKSSSREVKLVGVPPLPVVPVTSNRAARRGLPRIIRRAEVKHLTGLAYSTMYKLMRRGLFPECIHIPGTNAIGWNFGEIVAWVEATIENAKPQKPVEAKPVKKEKKAKPAPMRVGRPPGTTKQVMAQRRRKALDEALAAEEAR